MLGLVDRGGVTRLGISMYTTQDDIERTLEVIRKDLSDLIILLTANY